jgi:hypothetical protein
VRTEIIRNLSSELDAKIVASILDSYEELIAKHRQGDLEGALTKAGRFVEQTLRAIEGRRTGIVPSSVKSVAATIRTLENDAQLPESLRFLIPRVLYGMIYSARSKRDAVHVNEVDPRGIDVAMAVSAASWVIAELLRLFHVSDEQAVTHTMLALTRTSVPFIEAVGDEVFVGQQVKPSLELILLLSHAGTAGMTRKALGASAKCSASSVTRGLQTLSGDRLVHQSGDRTYFITSAGEAFLAQELQKAVAIA